MNDYDLNHHPGSSNSMTSLNQKLSTYSESTTEPSLGASDEVLSEPKHGWSSSTSTLSSFSKETLLETGNHLSGGNGFEPKDLLSSLFSPQSATCQSSAIDPYPDDSFLTGFFYSAVPFLVDSIIPDPLDLVAAAVGQSTAQALLAAQVK